VRRRPGGAGDQCGLIQQGVLAGDHTRLQGGESLSRERTDQMNQHSRSILLVSHYQTAICVVIASLGTLISAIVLYLLMGRIDAYIMWRWSPNSGDTVFSVKTTLFTFLCVGVFALFYAAATSLINSYLERQAQKK
jgi:hypothetical protein